MWFVHCQNKALNLSQTTRKTHASYPDLALIFLYISVHLDWNVLGKSKADFQKTITEDQTVRNDPFKAEAGVKCDSQYWQKQKPVRHMRNSTQWRPNMISAVRDSKQQQETQSDTDPLKLRVKRQPTEIQDCSKKDAWI